MVNCFWLFSLVGSCETILTFRDENVKKELQLWDFKFDAKLEELLNRNNFEKSENFPGKKNGKTVSKFSCCSWVKWIVTQRETNTAMSVATTALSS